MKQYKSITTLISLLFLVTFCVTNSYAETYLVTIEPTFKTEIDMSLATVSSTTNSSAFSAAFKLYGDTSYFSGNFRYAKVDQTRTEEKGYLRCGYDPEINDWLSLWFFEEAGYNDAIGLEFENSIGGGPKWRKRFTDKVAGSLSAGLLSHYTRFQEKSSEQLIRGSVRPKLKFNWKLLGFVFVGFYQPNIERFSDYILKGEVSLRYALTDIVGLKLKVEDEYRSISHVDENNELTTVFSLNVRM